MMDWNAYKNFLLNNIPGAKVVSGGKEILCRCRECPDSADPNHAHFYILDLVEVRNAFD